MKFRLKYAFRKRTKGWFYAKTITQHSALPCHGDRTFPDRKNGKHIALTLKDGKYTFIMLASSVEIKAEFTVKQDMLFADVKPVDYFYDAVQWAVENSITNGVSDTLFNFDADYTCAQAVTFLWRAEKAPAVDAESAFTDVESDAYYADAVQWALKNGVTNGTSASAFNPDASCTRAQIVTFLWRTLAA